MSLQAYLSELASLLNDQRGPKVSPQLAKKLTQVLKVDDNGPEGLKELHVRIGTLFRRLLLELVQAHYNTAQREQEFVSLVDKKGCTILQPYLTDRVICSLVKLYRASRDCHDRSFERTTLVDFLLKDIDAIDIEKHQVSKVFQTLYRCSCFTIKKGIGEPARFELRDDLCEPHLTRRQHDVELIKMARDAQIRLPPTSWHHLLYHGSKLSCDLTTIQSLLELHQPPVTVSELEMTIHKMYDRYGIVPLIQELRNIENLLENDSTVSVDTLRDVVQKLCYLSNLFTIRQSRGVR